MNKSEIDQAGVSPNPAVSSTINTMTDSMSIEYKLAILEQALVQIRHGRTTQDFAKKLSDTQMARLADRALKETGLGSTMPTS